jgi:hypothetical protein
VGFALLALLLSPASLLRAQIDNGNITGRVTDPASVVIVKAQVPATQMEMNFETATTTAGYGEPLTRGRHGESRPQSLEDS